MLRPATPLTILFFVAFVLLLLSTLSTPIIRAIPLSGYGDVTLGVFGFCQGDACTLKLGYTSMDINGGKDTTNTGVDLPSGARHELSYILIVHPIAAFLTLICTILAAASHFRSPAHSPRYLLGLFILCFPTLLISLLAFLVDILLFIPHMKWGGWIVLASTIIIVACTMLTCAMRRTLVSRKARKARIAENAEMNGEAHYANLAEQRARDAAMARAESPPPLDGTSINTAQEKFAQFTSMDHDRPRPSNEERIPLNPRDPSVRSGSLDRRRDGSGMPREGFENGAPVRGATVHGEPNRGTPLDQEERMRAMRRPSDPRSGYRTPPRGGGPPPLYGRGGRPTYPPPSRGGYPPRGYGPPPRGFRGGPAPRGGYGRPPPRGPPPPGWNGDGAAMGAAVAGGAMAGGAMMAYERRGPPPGYQNDYYRQDSYGQDSYDQGYYGGSRSGSRHGSQRPSQERPRIPGEWPSSEDILDQYTDSADRQDQPYYSSEQAIATSGSAHGSRGQSPRRPSSEYETRPSMSQTRDPASFGFSGRTPSVRGAAKPQESVPPVPPVMYDANVVDPGYGYNPYEADAYQSQGHGGVSPVGPAPGDNYQTTYLPRSHWQSEPDNMAYNGAPMQNTVAPVELPAPGIGDSPPPRASSERTVTRSRKASDAYYEDVEPRFSQDAPNPATYHHHQQDPEPTQHQPLQQPAPPALLHPGGYGIAHGQGGSLEPSNTSSMYSEPEGSDFTSISQRGVNPNYPGSGGVPESAASAQQRNEAILRANPDFEVPGAGLGRSKGAASHVRGMSGSLRYPGAAS